MSGDLIATLPVNPAVRPTQQDEVLVNHLFGVQDKVNTKALSSLMRAPLLVAGLTGLMLLPQTNDLIIRFIPSVKDNAYAMIVVKMIVIAILFYVLNNWSLARSA